MKLPTKKEIEVALKDAVECECLEKKGNGYRYHPSFKGKLLCFKGSKNASKEEVLLDVLYRSGYFKKPKSEREITVIVGLLAL